MLNAALREVSDLSRVCASFLSVVLVNTGGLGAAGPGSGSSSGHGERSLASLLPSLLQKTLDQGVDRHLLVSRVEVEGKGSGRMVEVIKDRVGDGLGLQYVDRC